MTRCWPKRFDEMKRARVNLTLFVVDMLVVLAAFDDLHGEQQTIETDDGYRLAYEKVGRGSDPVIVPARLFLAEPFRGLWSRQRTIVFYDMRDRGRSESIQDLSKISVENDV